MPVPDQAYDDVSGIQNQLNLLDSVRSLSRIMSGAGMTF